METDFTDRLKDLRNVFFDATEEYLVLLDENLNYIDVNKPALLGYGFIKEDIVGKHISEFVNDEVGKERIKKYKEVLVTGNSIVIEDVIQHAKLNKLNVRIKAFKAGDGLGIAMQDVTNLKQTIEELDTLSYKSSHDIRGPIANILGLARSGARKKDNPELVKQCFDLIFEQADRMDVILKGIMNTMRIRKGEKSVHRINFGVLIDGVYESFFSKADVIGIKFSKKVTTKVPFFGDKYVIGVIIENLVDNSIKYRSDEHEPYIHIEIETIEFGVLIEIKDNGIGIAKEMQDNIFKMFFRASYKSSGVGLGFYTVRQCVKKLEGHLDIESREGLGTTINVFLPSELDAESFLF